MRINRRILLRKKVQAITEGGSGVRLCQKLLLRALVSNSKAVAKKLPPPTRLFPRTGGDLRLRASAKLKCKCSQYNILNWKRSWKRSNTSKFISPFPPALGRSLRGDPHAADTCNRKREEKTKISKGMSNQRNAGAVTEEGTSLHCNNCHQYHLITVERLCGAACPLDRPAEI